MKRNFLLFAILLALTACQSQPPAQAVPTSLPIQPVAEIETTPTATSSLPPVITSAKDLNDPLQTSSADGMVQVYIPAGKFFMGGMDVYREHDEQPVNEISMPAFWIDQVEVTNGMYALCVQAGACPPPAQTRSDNREDYFGNIAFQDYPVVHVTWSNAHAYCDWAGRRLPTEAEWERAARGDDKRNYPWGDEPPNEFNANFMNLVGDTSRVGSYAEGASPFGLFDMAGNVWEWVEDRYRPDTYAKISFENPQGPAEAQVFNSFRVIRGGSYKDDGIFLRLANRNFAEGPNPKANEGSAEFAGKDSNQIGFRCAASE